MNNRYKIEYTQKVVSYFETELELTDSQKAKFQNCMNSSDVSRTAGLYGMKPFIPDETVFEAKAAVHAESPLKVFDHNDRRVELQLYPEGGFLVVLMHADRSSHPVLYNGDSYTLAIQTFNTAVRLADIL